MPCPICGSDRIRQSGGNYLECKDCNADWNPAKKPGYGLQPRRRRGCFPVVLVGLAGLAGAVEIAVRVAGWIGL
jgi:hypothetical protein